MAGNQEQVRTTGPRAIEAAKLIDYLMKISFRSLTNDEVNRVFYIDCASVR